MNPKTVDSQTVVASADRFVALPEDHPFHFSCVSDGCDLRCCTTGHPLVLNPFEIHLLSRRTGLSFDTLEDSFFVESYDADTNFPLVTIARDRTCGFLKDRTCSVYEARPLVCRLFPLGKYYDPHDKGFRTVMLSDNPCAGFSSATLQTVAQYRNGQRTNVLDAMWNAWTDFVNLVEEHAPLPDSDLFRSVFAMFVYNCDLPPAPEIYPDRYERMSLEESFHIRLRTALDALPKLQTIFEKSRARRTGPPPMTAS